MTVPRRRRTAARPSKAERKAQLLAAAKNLFATLGYARVDVETIAAVAGVSETLFARYFKTKRDVFAEVVQEIRQATVVRWQTETAVLSDPPAKLHAVADLYIAAAHAHPVEFLNLHRALIEGTEEEETRTLVRDYYLECETLLAGIIEEGQQSGVFRRSLDPRIGAWELIRSNLGYSLTEPLGVPLYGEPDYVTRAVDCLLHCLLKTDV
jgi:AcrR family transcriptional regulator